MSTAAIPGSSLFWRTPRAAVDDDATVIEVPPRVPGYRLLRPVGRGRRTRVWLAFDLTRHADVVVKLETAPGTSLQRECAVAARVESPLLVRLNDHGRTNAWSYIAMEHVPGGNLAARLGQPLPRELALAVLRQAAEAVAQLHRHGLVHRDVKPANFLVRTDARLVLGDFGLTVDVGSVDDDAQPGVLFGTPRYVAPEQLQGAAAAPAADVYSLGVLLYALLAGRSPFPGEPLQEICAQQLFAQPAPLPAAVADLQPLVDRMLSKEVQCRLPDADAVLGLIGQRC